jgi:uncharacterized protein YjbI with pentapeptide repeats
VRAALRGAFLVYAQLSDVSAQGTDLRGPICGAPSLTDLGISPC